MPRIRIGTVSVVNRTISLPKGAPTAAAKGVPPRGSARLLFSAPAPPQHRHGPGNAKALHDAVRAGVRDEFLPVLHIAAEPIEAIEIIRNGGEKQARHAFGSAVRSPARHGRLS